MADDKLQVTGSDAAIKQVDGDSLTVAGTTVFRERDRIAGGAAAELADVRNAAPGASDYGLVTRVADGHNVVEGLTTDAAVTSDVNGTLSAKLRGLVKMLADVWDSVNHRLNVAVGGTVAISAAALPLPSGAATAALQTQPGVDIGDITINNASGAAAVNVQDGGNSITVDAAALPLPTGASTSANQTTEIASLANLDAALSTRLKPADTLAAVTTLGTITSVVHVDDNAGSLTVDGTVAISSSALPTGGALEAGNLASIADFQRKTETELLTAILLELKVQTAMLQVGLNVRDDPDTYRNDPSFLN